MTTSTSTTTENIVVESTIEESWVQERTYHTIQCRDIQPLVNLSTDLGIAFPEELYAVGNSKLLNERSVALTASRNASNVGRVIVQKVADLVSAEGYVTIVGGTRDADLIVMNATHKRSGSVIIVLAEGIKQFDYEPYMEVLEQGRLLVLSAYEGGNWDVDRAMERNSIISALVDLIIIGECTGFQSSGTFDLVMTSLIYGREVYLPNVATLKALTVVPIKGNMVRLNDAQRSKEIEARSKLHRMLVAKYGVEFFPEGKTPAEQVKKMLGINPMLDC